MRENVWVEKIINVPSTFPYLMTCTFFPSAPYIYCGAMASPSRVHFPLAQTIALSSRQDGPFLPVELEMTLGEPGNMASNAFALSLASSRALVSEWRSAFGVPKH